MRDAAQAGTAPLLVPVALFTHTVARCSAPMREPSALSCRRVTRAADDAKMPVTSSEAAAHLLVCPIQWQIVNVAKERNLGFEYESAKDVESAFASG